MRSIRHWSLRYARDKVHLLIYERTHPDAPWLTADAVEFLNVWLQPAHTGLEWGAGRSTAWLARRVATLTSVESDVRWHDRVQGQIAAQALTNVTLLLMAADSPDYPGVVERFPDVSLDFALVDGVNATRADCVAAVLPKIRPGGLCVIDDIQRFFPSDSHSPEAIPAHGAPATSQWAQLAQVLQLWKPMWTTNGIKDTALYRKPSA